jgi:hypothetical protein
MAVKPLEVKKQKGNELSYRVEVIGSLPEDLTTTISRLHAEAVLASAPAQDPPEDALPCDKRGGGDGAS